MNCVANIKDIDLDQDQLRKIALGQADPLPHSDLWLGYSFYTDPQSQKESDARPSLRVKDLVWALDNLG